MNGQLLSIRKRMPTATPAATTIVAQIEFAASQIRQEITKLDENETDEPLRIRFLIAFGEKPLKYRLTLIVVPLLGRIAFRSTRSGSQAR